MTPSLANETKDQLHSNIPSANRSLQPTLKSVSCRRSNYAYFCASWTQLEPHADFLVVTRVRCGLLPPVLAVALDDSRKSP